MPGRMREDIRTILARDPAAYHWLHVLLFYPGLHALWVHRIAGRLWRAQWRGLALALASLSRWLTGIEIHPGARIGRRFFIDHGMGVVIGETAEVGDDVTLYHGVTLGGVSLERGKRHPTLEDGVVVGAGAKVLGAITIGRETRIGANAVVVKDVGRGCVVVGIPGRPVTRLGQMDGVDLHHDELPDVVAQRLGEMQQRLEALEAELAHLRREAQAQPRYAPEEEYE